MPKGNYAALKELTPITTDLGKIVRDQEAIDAQKRAEQLQEERMKQEEERYRTEKVDKSREKLATDLSNMKEVVMNSPSGDFSLAHGVNLAMDRKVQVWGELQKHSGETTPDVLALQLEYTNLDKYSEKLATVTKPFIALHERVTKGLIDGDLSTTQNGALATELENTIIKSQFVTGIDKNGDPTIIRANPETGVMEEKPYREFFAEFLLKEPIKAFKPIEFQKEMKNSIGTLKTIKQAAGSYTTTTDVELKKDAQINLANTVKGIIGTDPENMTGEAKAIWEENMGGKPGEANYKAIEEYITKLGLAAVDEEHSSVYNTSAAESAYRASHPTKETPETSDLAVMRGTDGSISQFTVHYAMSETPDVGTGFTLPKPVKFGIGDDVVDIDSYYLTGRNTIQYRGMKKITIPTTRLGGKPTESWEYVDGGDMNDTQTNRFARALKLKDNYELIQKSKELMGVEPQASSTSTQTQASSTSTMNTQSSQSSPMDLRTKYGY